MADTIQTLGELSALKPTAAPQPAQYVQKLDKQGRGYATGKRKDAVALVWVKPGAGKIVINTRELEVYFSRPVRRIISSADLGPHVPDSYGSGRPSAAQWSSTGSRFSNSASVLAASASA